MKQFSCGDVVPGCTAVFREPDVESVLASVARHARLEHDLVVVPPELVEQVTAATTTAEDPT